MAEAGIIQSVADIHQAVYNLMVQSVNGVVAPADCVGFDSSHKTPAIPQKGIKVAVTDWQVDRSRPTPLEGNRIEENLGNIITKTYDGVAYTGYEARRYRYPLPVMIIYSFYTWSHKALDQFAIDHAFLKKFPERGVLDLMINGTEYEFPIEMLTSQTLDDLNQNLRERVYQFRLEVWIPGHRVDRDGKIITSITEEVFATDPLDVTQPGQERPDLILELNPDE
jgi:hypothetical protein